MKPTQTKEMTQQQRDDLKLESYSIEISRLSDEDGGGFQALYPPLARSIVGYGETSAEAIAELEGLVPSFLNFLAETGQEMPDAPAEKAWEEFSGKFNVRVPRLLHAQLVMLAEDQGVSLNSLIQTVLASAATALTAGKMFGIVEPTASFCTRPMKDRWDGERPKMNPQDIDITRMFPRERSQDNWEMAQENTA